MKKSLPVAPAFSSPNPVFWVNASPGAAGTLASGKPADAAPAFPRPFRLEPGRSRERSRQRGTIRHYVVYEEPDTAID